MPPKNDASIIVGLLNTRTVADAAKAARVSSRTIERRLADPDFVEQYRSAQLRVIDTATSGLANASYRAVIVLENLMESRTESIRLRAATATLTLAVPLLKYRDLEKTVARLGQVADALAKAKEVCRGKVH
jgi:hypothetical protein